jgi:hypothetical protein
MAQVVELLPGKCKALSSTKKKLKKKKGVGFEEVEGGKERKRIGISSPGLGTRVLGIILFH